MNPARGQLCALRFKTKQGSSLFAFEGHLLQVLCLGFYFYSLYQAVRMRPLSDSISHQQSTLIQSPDICKNQKDKEDVKMLTGEEDMDDAIIFPITDLQHGDEHHDGEYEATSDEDDESNVTGRYANKKKKAKEFKPLMSRRQLRRIKLGFSDQSELMKLNFDGANKPTPMTPESPMSAGKAKWMSALKKIKKMEDPWAKFHIDELPIERCMRHRYNALKQKWVQDEVTVKMEAEVRYYLYTICSFLLAKI